MTIETGSPETGDDQAPAERDAGPRDAEGGPGSLPSARRSEVQSTRRDGTDRRRGAEPFDGDDRRRVAERRSGGERRCITFDVACRTSGRIERIEDWLDGNCDGRWRIVLLDVGDDLVTKSVRIMFELASDRDSFHHGFVRGAE